MKFGWKSVAGAILWAGSIIVRPELAPAIANIVQGVGVLLSVVGLRHAIAKNGAGA